ncbi:MAG TPA: C40 family peptidase [Methylococcaceae bacterium]|nr:C40 family peptidase [Methylococcaceae bacterium]
MLIRAATNHLGKPRIRIACGLALLLLSGCAGTPPAPAVPNADDLISYATGLTGAPYRFGGTDPERGFDCSGFVQHVYARFGVPLPRTTHEMAERLSEIPLEQCENGDLLFFNIANKPFSHVGLYLGHGHFIHAPSDRSGGVTISSLERPFWRKRFAGARRPAPLPGQ